MTKLDLKDAYLTVAINPQSQKFIRFIWKNKAYQFKALPFGLNVAPLVFTKLLKPVAAFLRKRGIRLVLYLDDMLIIGSSVQETTKFTQIAMDLLGFHYTQGEINNNPNPDYHLSGVYHQFKLQTDKPTLRESEENSNTLPSNAYGKVCLTEHVSPAPRCTRVSPSRYLEGPSAFSPSTSTVNQRFTETQSPVQHQYQPVKCLQNGTSMVVGEHTTGERKPNSGTTPRYNNIYRRVKNGLGRCLQQC